MSCRKERLFEILYTSSETVRYNWICSNPLSLFMYVSPKCHPFSQCSKYKRNVWRTHGQIVCSWENKFCMVQKCIQDLITCWIISINSYNASIRRFCRELQVYCTGENQKPSLELITLHSTSHCIVLQNHKASLAVLLIWQPWTWQKCCIWDGVSSQQSSSGGS